MSKLEIRKLSEVRVTADDMAEAFTNAFGCEQARFLHQVAIGFQGFDADAQMDDIMKQVTPAAQGFIRKLAERLP